MGRQRFSYSARQAVWLAVGLVASLLMVEPALAQRGRSLRRLFGISQAQLASHPDVQTELKMTDVQKTRVTEVNDELRDSRRELWGTTFDNWTKAQARMDELNRAATQKVIDVLDPAQRQRLQEISIQQNGPRSLQDPDVVRELGLSDQQKTKLDEAIAQNTKDFETGFGQGSREEWRERANQLADEADRRFLGVLTDEQKTKLEELKGEPFEVDLSQFFFRGRGNR
jgi:hypothetical protein